MPSLTRSERRLSFDDAVNREGAIRREAAEREMILRVARSRKWTLVQWTFAEVATGNNVLHWWPGTGCWESPGGLRGQVHDPWEVLEVVTRLYLQLPIDPDEKPFP